MALVRAVVAPRGMVFVGHPVTTSFSRGWGFVANFSQRHNWPFAVAVSGPVLSADSANGWAFRPLHATALRVNNGPEYIGGTLQNWAERAGIALMYIPLSRGLQANPCRATGNPQQNAYIERYNRTVRTEWLGRYHFDSIEDVQDHATRWLWTYNNERPNMGIGGITPIQKLRNAA